MRRLGSVYYHLEIRELPGPDSFHPEQAPEASDRSLVNQALPPTLPKAPKGSDQAGGQGQGVKGPQDEGKGQEKKKPPSEAKDKAQDVVTSQPSQAADPLAPKTKT